MWCGVHSASECDGLSQGVRWMLFFWLVSVVRNKEEGMIYSDRVRVRIHPDSMLLSLVGSSDRANHLVYLFLRGPNVSHDNYYCLDRDDTLSYLDSCPELQTYMFVSWTPPST